MQKSYSFIYIVLVLWNFSWNKKGISLSLFLEKLHRDTVLKNPSWVDLIVVTLKVRLHPEINLCLPWWRKGSQQDCGSGNPGLIPGLPSSCVCRLMARRLKTSSYVPSALVGIGLAPKRPLTAHGIWFLAAGLNLETGQLSRRYIAEILLNVTLNHSQPTNKPEKTWSGENITVSILFLP